MTSTNTERRARKAPPARRWLKVRPTSLPAAPALSLAMLLVSAPGAFAFITPEAGGSPNANSIDSLYKIVLYIAAVVFVVVEGALGEASYRVRPQRHKGGPP